MNNIEEIKNEDLAQKSRLGYKKKTLKVVSRTYLINRKVFAKQNTSETRTQNLNVMVVYQGGRDGASGS